MDIRTIVRSCLLIPVLLCAAGPAGALESLPQNEFTTAESLDAGMTQSGIFLAAGEDYLSFYPAFRLGLGALFEGGIRAGAITVDIGTKDKLSAMAGADLKYQLIKQTEDIPVDMAIDVSFDAVFLSGDTVSELAFSAIVSRGIPLSESGYKITPYAGAEVSAQYSSSLYVTDETNVYAFGGVEWKLSQKFMITAELKSGSSTVGGLGIKFEY